jgi:hypothetical protein
MLACVMAILIASVSYQRVQFNNRQSLQPDSSYRGSLHYLLQSYKEFSLISTFMDTSRWKITLYNFGDATACDFWGSPMFSFPKPRVTNEVPTSRSKGSTAFLW